MPSFNGAYDPKDYPEADRAWKTQHPTLRLEGLAGAYTGGGSAYNYTPPVQIGDEAKFKEQFMVDRYAQRQTAQEAAARQQAAQSAESAKLRQLGAPVSSASAPDMPFYMSVPRYTGAPDMPSRGGGLTPAQQAQTGRNTDAYGATLPASAPLQAVAPNPHNEFFHGLVDRGAKMFTGFLGNMAKQYAAMNKPPATMDQQANPQKMFNPDGSMAVREYPATAKNIPVEMAGIPRDEDGRGVIEQGGGLPAEITNPAPDQFTVDAQNHMAGIRQMAKDITGTAVTPADVQRVGWDVNRRAGGTNGNPTGEIQPHLVRKDGTDWSTGMVRDAAANRQARQLGYADATEMNSRAAQRAQGLDQTSVNAAQAALEASRAPEAVAARKAQADLETAQRDQTRAIVRARQDEQNLPAAMRGLNRENFTAKEWSDRIALARKDSGEVTDADMLRAQGSLTPQEKVANIRAQQEAAKQEAMSLRHAESLGFKGEQAKELARHNMANEQLKADTIALKERVAQATNSVRSQADAAKFAESFNQDAANILSRANADGMRLLGTAKDEDDREKLQEIVDKNMGAAQRRVAEMAKQRDALLAKWQQQAPAASAAPAQPAPAARAATSGVLPYGTPNWTGTHIADGKGGWIPKT